ncbi:hypothetical protein JCM18918_2420 [Cutibacterium acnes JCM 18918]|nr:hypothetical protein JCM18918_2420 [Cutibacterium acnes JCM 18918]
MASYCQCAAWHDGRPARIIDQVTADEVARAAREELGAEEECVYEWLGLVVEVLVEVELSE